jgi:hypothetical protein
MNEIRTKIQMQSISQRFIGLLQKTHFMSVLLTAQQTTNTDTTRATTNMRRIEQKLQIIRKQCLSYLSGTYFHMI